MNPVTDLVSTLWLITHTFKSFWYRHELKYSHAMNYSLTWCVIIQNQVGCMGWQDDSRAPNTLMSNHRQVSCCRDEISPFGCLLGEKGSNHVVWWQTWRSFCLVSWSNASLLQWFVAFNAIQNHYKLWFENTELTQHLFVTVNTENLKTDCMKGLL